MINFLLILGISVIMFKVDFPKTKGKKKDRAVYLCLLFFGLGLFAADMFHIEMPNPLYVIIFLFKPITSWINKLLK